MLAKITDEELDAALCESKTTNAYSLMHKIGERERESEIQMRILNKVIRRKRLGRSSPSTPFIATLIQLQKEVETLTNGFVKEAGGVNDDMSFEAMNALVCPCYDRARQQVVGSSLRARRLDTIRFL